MDGSEELKYEYIQKIKECNICYTENKEIFKCKLCTFLCCPKCFNNFNFLHDVTYCPICKY